MIKYTCSEAFVHLSSICRTIVCIKKLINFTLWLLKKQCYRSKYIVIVLNKSLRFSKEPHLISKTVRCKGITSSTSTNNGSAGTKMRPTLTLIIPNVPRMSWNGSRQVPKHYNTLQLFLPASPSKLIYQLIFHPCAQVA